MCQLAELSNINEPNIENVEGKTIPKGECLST